MGIHFLLNGLNQHPATLFFLSSYLGGEELIVPLSILVGHGLWSFKLLFVVCFLGTILADLTWFLLGRHGVRNRKFFQKYKHRYDQMSVFMRKFAKNELTLLLTAKFIYGTRIFTIIYVGLNGLSVPKFLVFNTIVTFIWLLIVTAVGWMIGTGSAIFLSIYEHPIMLSLGIIGLIIVFHNFRNYVSRKILPPESSL